MGASDNPSRYSYLAIKRLVAAQHPVIAIGKRNGEIDSVSIITGQPIVEDVDTITLYLNEHNQKEYYDYILSLNPKRIIFNPGAENSELSEKAIKQGIEIMEACTLVLLSTGQY